MDIIFDNMDMIGSMFFICCLAKLLNLWRLCLQLDNKRESLQKVLLIVSIILAVCSIYPTLVTIAIDYCYHGYNKQKHTKESINASNENFKNYQKLFIQPREEKIKQLEKENQQLRNQLTQINLP